MNHQEAAQSCFDFLMALVGVGFNRDEALVIVAAWYGRSGTDMAALNAVYENFAEKLAADIRGEDE